MSASAARRFSGSSSRTFSYARAARSFFCFCPPELGDLEEETDLGLCVGFLRLLLLEDADELVPLAALGVEDLEVVPAAEREVLLLQGLLRLAIVRIDREERAPRGDRALVVVQAVSVERPELREDLDLLALSYVTSACFSRTSTSLSKSFERS